MSYSPDIADKICARIASGESLRAICRDDGMPEARTVHYWIVENEEFFQQYARAREAQADTLAEETIEIADDGSNDWMERHDPKNPGYEFNGEHVQRSRLRVDARKWFASKVAPKKYGERIDHEHGGNVGLQVNIIRFSDAELIDGNPEQTRALPKPNV